MNDLYHGSDGILGRLPRGKDGGASYLAEADRTAYPFGRSGGLGKPKIGFLGTCQQEASRGYPRQTSKVLCKCYQQ